MEASPTGPPQSARGTAVQVVAVFALSLTLYLVSFDVQSDGLILGNDVVPYAEQVARGSHAGLWNPHHLLFHPLTAGVADALAKLADTTVDQERVLRAQKLVSALGGALAAALLFRFAAGVCGARRAWLLTAAFATAAGNWLYSAVGETYMPANAALVGLLACALGLRLGPAARPAPPGPFAAVALFAWLLLAVLFRQDSVLVVPALMLILPVRRWFWPTAAAGAVSLGAYALAWRAAGVDVEFLPWLRGLADTGNWGVWYGWQAVKIAAGTTGTALTYLVFHWTALGLALWALGVGALLPPRTWHGSGQRAAIGLAVFAVGRFAFFAWWQPGNMEYHTGTLVPLFLLAAMLVGRPRQPGVALLQAALLASFAVLVAVGNWLVLIGPNRADDLGTRAEVAFEMAGEQGLVIAIDRLQYYALKRGNDTGVELFDASAIMPHPPGELTGELARVRDEALARMTAARARGGTLVFAVDTIFAHRLHWTLPQIEGLSAILPPGIGTAMRTGQSEAEQLPWAWVIAPGD